MSNDEAVSKAINAIFEALKQIAAKLNYLEAMINQSNVGKSNE